MHFAGHLLSAVPFALLGMPAAAVGAVLPDVTWIGNEIRFRRSSVRPWHRWVEGLPARRIRPYRVAHSFLLPALLMLLPYDAARQLALGWVVHLLLDLPTHWGVMRQQPLYPLAWRWPWTFRN